MTLTKILEFLKPNSPPKIVTDGVQFAIKRKRRWRTQWLEFNPGYLGRCCWVFNQTWDCWVEEKAAQKSLTRINA